MNNLGKWSIKYATKRSWKRIIQTNQNWVREPAKYNLCFSRPVNVSYTEYLDKSEYNVNMHIEKN